MANAPRLTPAPVPALASALVPEPPVEAPAPPPPKPPLKPPLLLELRLVKLLSPVVKRSPITADPAGAPPPAFYKISAIV